MDKKIKILVVPSDRTGVGKYRSTNPHLHLEKLFPEDFHVDIDYEPKLNDNEWLKQYDIIHYHRTLGNYDHMEKLLNNLDSLGIITIMDIDDYWSPDNKHPAYHIIKQNKLDVKIRNNIKLARNIITTTPIFASEIKKINKSVKVLPNAIDSTEKQFQIKEVKSDKIRIGWLGGSSHKHDLKLLEGTVAKLRNDNLIDKIQFVLCGFDTRGKIREINPKTGQQKERNILPHETVWVQYERIFTDNYSIVSPEYKRFLHKFTQEEFDGVEKESYRRVWTKPINEYASNYNLFDISLAPLVENNFNKVKSQLKVIESGFFKKPIIAQDFGPYQIDIQNAYIKGGDVDTTKNGFLVDSKRNHKQWYQYLKKLIQNPELIEIFGNNLYNTVKHKYSLNKVTEDRAKYYKNLVFNNKS